MPPRNPYKHLEKAIGYRFRDRSKLAAALVHPSYRHEHPGQTEDNQRLEFLGDAALHFASAIHFFLMHPLEPEGELTARRSRWTSRETLARLGREIGLGEYIQLGRGEQLSGGAQRDSTLGDALEAVVGAAYLDGGWPAVRMIFSRLLVARLGGDGAMTPDNPKGRLQEVCQKSGQTIPRYRSVSVEGPSHARIFTVEVFVADASAGRGVGPTRRAAETAAAREALARLSEPPPAAPAADEKAGGGA